MTGLLLVCGHYADATERLRYGTEAWCWQCAKWELKQEGVMGNAEAITNIVRAEREYNAAMEEARKAARYAHEAYEVFERARAEGRQTVRAQS